MNVIVGASSNLINQVWLPGIFYESEMEKTSLGLVVRSVLESRTVS